MAQKMPAKRPASVTLTAWGVFSLGTVNLWRAISLAHQASVLTALGISPSPGFQLTIALSWAVLLWALAILTWGRYMPARWAVPLALSFYAAFQLGLAVIVARSPQARRTAPALAVAFAVAVAFSLWALRRQAVASCWRPLPGQRK